MTTEELHRQRARSTINQARRGDLPKPKASVISMQSSSSSGNNIFKTARENSIEVYDDKFGRNSILTRSARMRKFRFYQYKPIQDTSTGTTPKSATNKTLNSDKFDGFPRKNILDSPESSPQSPSSAVLLPREDILQGKVALVASQSKEISELDNEISELERKIEDLNRSSNRDLDNLDEIFDLVNRKNDLLRRQMQLNILEQEKILEKANQELTKELRSLMSIDDSKKTRAEFDRQQYLYEQSLALVDKRNQLVNHMDVQEKCIDEDNELKATLKSVISDTNARNRLNSQNQNCCIQ